MENSSSDKHLFLSLQWHSGPKSQYFKNFNSLKFHTSGPREDLGKKPKSPKNPGQIFTKFSQNV